MWNGRVGVWSRELRYSRDRGDARDAAAELEQLGYAALWIPDVGGDVFGACEELLAATRSIPLLTGILNIWMHDAAEVAARSAALGERFTLGLGASHEALIGERYAKPLSAMRAYLDELDALGSRASGCWPRSGRRCSSSRATRAAGAHPYLVPVEHTRRAREILGPDRALAVEQGVVLARDRDAPPARTSPRISSCPTTSPTSAGSGTATRISPAAAATRSSTRWSRGVTRRRSPSACARSSRRARTTSASR